MKNFLLSKGNLRYLQKYTKSLNISLQKLARTIFIILKTCPLEQVFHSI